MKSKERKQRRTLIRQPFPKKSKLKENNDVDDEDDVVPLPMYLLLLLNHNLQSHAALLIITGQLPL